MGKLSADASHLVEQRFRKKAGSFSNAEFNVSPYAGIETVPHGTVSVGLEPRIEITTEWLDHAYRLILERVHSGNQIWNS
jgi:hypothetical protein